MRPTLASRWALAALLLSILCIGAAVFITLKTQPVFGPMTMVVAPGGELWLDLDGELWRVAPDGHLIDRRPWAALGLPGPPANLLRHPDGGLVATVRRDSTLYRLDPQSAQVRSRLQPQWPAELQADGGRAINLAFHPDGRFAVATGGGHAVALFDARGGFLARTPAGTYRFTNGLWWVGDALWTTDTNRSQLKQLDGRTLALQQTVSLPPRGAMQYLGPARAKPQPSADGTAQIGLIRFDNGMDRGTATVLTVTGQETPLNASEGLLPRDLDWMADTLLLSDGASFSIKRWSSSGAALLPFGDAGLQAALGSGLRARGQAQWQRNLAFGAAAACWLFAGLMLWWGRHGQPAGERPALDVSQLGTPIVSNSALIRLGLRLHWPFVLALLPLGVFELFDWLASHQGSPARAAMAVVGSVVSLLALMALPRLLRRFKRLATQPEFEPLLNAAALRHLRSDRGLPALLRAGERLQETWTQQAYSQRWLVLTDQRLLVFAPGLMGHKLESDIALADITHASLLPGALTLGEKFKAARTRKGLQQRLRPQAAWLEIGLRDGRVLAGAVQSTPLAERLARRLSQ